MNRKSKINEKFKFKITGVAATDTIDKIKEKARVNEQLILESIGKANRGKYCTVRYATLLS